jgi:hypothetical protein
MQRAPHPILPHVSATSGENVRMNQQMKSDRRSYVRIPVKLPGAITSLVSRPFSRNCTVMNISRGGALVALAKLCAPAGSKLGLRVRLEIALAIASGYAARSLACEGTVIRMSASVAQPVELALRLSRMEFRDAGGVCVERASTRQLITTFKVAR